MSAKRVPVSADRDDDTTAVEGRQVESGQDATVARSVRLVQGKPSSKTPEPELTPTENLFDDIMKLVRNS